MDPPSPPLQHTHTHTLTQALLNTDSLKKAKKQTQIELVTFGLFLGGEKFLITRWTERGCRDSAGKQTTWGAITLNKCPTHIFERLIFIIKSSVSARPTKQIQSVQVSYTNTHAGKKTTHISKHTHTHGLGCVTGRSLRNQTFNKAEVVFSFCRSCKMQLYQGDASRRNRTPHYTMYYKYAVAYNTHCMYKQKNAVTSTLH